MLVCCKGCGAMRSDVFPECFCRETAKTAAPPPNCPHGKGESCPICNKQQPLPEKP